MRETRDPTAEAFAPCSSQGQALDPRFSRRFRGGDGNLLQTRALFSVGHLGVAQVQPRQALLRKYVPCRPEPCRLIECTDVKMCFLWQPIAFAGQRRPAFGTESPLHAGRRAELGDLALGNDVNGALECREDRYRRTAMPATTLAMAPCHPFRLTGGHKAHRAAQAAALELIIHGNRA